MEFSQFQSMMIFLWIQKRKKYLVVTEEVLWNTEPGQEGVESFHYPATDLITSDLTSLLEMDENLV